MKLETWNQPSFPFSHFTFPFVILHPLPLWGLPPVSGGESVTVENTLRQPTVPLRQGGTRSGATEGVDRFPFSVHFVPLRQAGRGAERRRGWIVSDLIPLYGLESAHAR